MPIPDYQTIMHPFLSFLGDEKEHTLHDAVDSLAIKFALTDDELSALLPSGQQTIFINRVSWARTYLKKAGLVDSPRRAIIKITKRGKQELNNCPDQIDVKYLMKYPEFYEFKSKRHTKERSNEEGEVEATPEEVLENAYFELRQSLATDLLVQVKACSPTQFERLVVQLLVKMGYGGSLVDAGRAIGKSGDEGIDGIIKEDKLGLDAIYIQAKKWDARVGRPEIQKFAGALQGQRAKKGIFISTSYFSKEAIDFIGKIESKIVLIDGEQLARLMIDHNLGVTAIVNYELKRIDSDFFNED